MPVDIFTVSRCQLEPTMMLMRVVRVNQNNGLKDAKMLKMEQQR